MQIVNFFAALGEKVLGLAERADTTGRKLLAHANFFGEMASRIEPGVLKLVDGMQEFAELMDAVGAKYEDDENAIFWASAIGHLEGMPDPLLVVILRRYFEQPDFGERSLSEFRDLLDHHRSRRARPEEIERSEEEAAKIRQGIKKYPSFRLALDRLALKAQTGEGKGQTVDEVLEEMIPGVAYVERAALQDDEDFEDLVNRVADRIRREGLERPDKPELVVTPGPELLPRVAEELARGIKDREEAALVAREVLAETVRAAGLSRQEVESWAFAELFGNKEAAEVLGRSPGQIAQEKMRANSKIRGVG